MKIKHVIVKRKSSLQRISDLVKKLNQPKTPIERISVLNNLFASKIKLKEIDDEELNKLLKEGWEIVHMREVPFKNELIYVLKK